MPEENTKGNNFYNYDSPTNKIGRSPFRKQFKRINPIKMTLLKDKEEFLNRMRNEMEKFNSKEETSIISNSDDIIGTDILDNKSTFTECNVHSEEGDSKEFEDIKKNE
ncbi:hypothetical protein CWI38_2364p0020 [Hamiltosporidium tvaerminnensis]|uniref:Uncharacterized protein n=1 Tax=Hamiltosporidium tvaerminnensis TaxID=1176355 RepID=A0A4Q9LIQ0_9MICR|nr:hypothetical protein CWI38_2364p0020 [Hamiltosporidium tvaerminnensis]